MNVSNIFLSWRVPLLRRFSVGMEGGEEIAEELQDRNKSNARAEGQDQ